MTSKLLVIALSLVSFNGLQGQNILAKPKITKDPTEKSYHGPTRWVLAYQPGQAETVNGLAFGFLGHDVICNAPYNQTTNGINLQLGGGFVHWKKVLSPTLYPENTYNKEPKSITNGVQCSLFGTQTDRINGLAISGFVSTGERLNGLALNLGCSYYEELQGVSVGLRNTSYETKGMQVGLFNTSKKMSGLQIGLWNTIGGRSLPLINFSR